MANPLKDMSLFIAIKIKMKLKLNYVRFRAQQPHVATGIRQPCKYFHHHGTFYLTNLI